MPRAALLPLSVAAWLAPLASLLPLRALAAEKKVAASSRIFVANGPEARWKPHVDEVLEDPRLAEACPTCDPLPRTLPEACAVLRLRPRVLPWQLSFWQMPFNFVGNYLSNALFAYAAARSLGMPFLVVSTEVDLRSFEEFHSWVWRTLIVIPAVHGAGEVDGVDAELACGRCAGMYPHECAGARRIWEVHSKLFAAALREGLNATVLRTWGRATRSFASVPGWPGETSHRVRLASRSVAVHFRCGDALLERSAQWGMLPLSFLLAAAGERDHFAVFTATRRGGDKPFFEVCRRTLSGLTDLLIGRGVAASAFFNQEPGLDLARLAFADVALCGASSTFCLWGALAATTRGGQAYVPAGRVFMNASRPRLSGLHWLDVPKLARGRDVGTLLRAIKTN